MTSITAASTICFLKELFARYGVPYSLTCDNGPQFIAKKFQEFCDLTAVILHHLTPFWPQAHGEIERF